MHFQRGFHVMSHRRLRELLLLWLLLWPIWSSPVSAQESPAAPASDQDAIRIGVVGPFSGPSSFVGPAQLNGVRLAVEEFNARGGLDGRPVEVLWEDDRGWPERSEAAVARLIRQEGVVAIIGPNNSACTMVDMQVCAYYKVPLLTADATATKITSRGNRWIFRCIESDYFRLAALSEFLVEEQSLRHIGIFYENDDYGDGLRTDLENNLKRYGLKIDFVYPFNRGHRDFTDGLREAERRGVQALGLFGITSDNLRIAAQAERVGLDVQLFTPGVNERYISEGGEAVEGLVSTDSFYVYLDKEPLIRFMQAYASRFNETPGPISGRAYDTARILLNALRRARVPAGQSLRNTIISTENFPGITGDFNFKSNGDVVKKVHIIAIHDGRFVPAREWRARSASRRWFIYTALALAGVFVLGNWMLVVIRRTLRRRRAERIRQQFTPIRVNPYIVGNPVRDRKMFFGRDDDFDFMRKNLARKDSGVCVVICGERRSGKTSILYQVLDGRLGDQFTPILIDLQLYGNVSSPVDFFSRMARDIRESLRRLGEEVQEGSQTSGESELERLIDDLNRHQAERRILLLLDEYEIIESLVRNGALQATSVAFLAGLLERHPAMSYVLTGSTRLEERERDFWEPLVGKSLYRKISFLTSRDTLRLITEPLADLVHYEDGVPEAIQRLTAGQPFYTQAVCMTVVDHLNEVRHNVVSLEDLGEVVEQLVENPLPQMLYFWESFSPAEKMLLSLLADVLSGTPDGPPRADDLIAHALELQLPVSYTVENVLTMLESLNGRDVLVKEDRRFQFRMDLFRVWVHREHSPWQMVGEISQR